MLTCAFRLDVAESIAKFLYLDQGQTAVTEANKMPEADIFLYIRQDGEEQEQIDDTATEQMVSQLNIGYTGDGSCNVDTTWDDTVMYSVFR